MCGIIFNLLNEAIFGMIETRERNFFIYLRYSAKCRAYFFTRIAETVLLVY